MCEFYLKGKCFHPKKVARGEIASTCEAHTCNDCTSSSWKANKVKEQLLKFKELIELSGGKLPNLRSIETQAETMTRLFDQENLPTPHSIE
jgi:hypothetical protein